MDIPEAKQDPEQNRQAREGDDDSTDNLNVYRCPIEGCSRTVLDNPGDLRNHVTQSNDHNHRQRTLDEDLQVVVHWE